MKSLSLMFVNPPKLSDKSAAEVLDFLYELINAYENHYGRQLRRYYESGENAQIDLFDMLEDELPPF
jgi:hypothetical protein